ncbi:MAG: recombinase family protein [Leptolyngbya sp. SIO4C5]|nr:recombinase family protein [Leptolyngbya sp. SIO4C5]
MIKPLQQSQDYWYGVSVIFDFDLALSFPSIKNYSMTKFSFAYGRVSSEEQAENQHAAEQQFTRLLNSGITKSHILFDVQSGQSDSRPEFSKLLKLIEIGKVKEIIATRWDRLSRNFTVYHQLKELLQLKRVRLRLLDQGEVDFDSASGEFSADIQALLAVNEVRMLSERVSRGHAHRRARKASFGRAPWGYRVVDEKFQIDNRPIICLLEQQPDNPDSFRDLADDDPQIIRGISKGEIAREAVELLFKLRRPQKVLKTLTRTYGVQRKSYVVCKKQYAQDVHALLSDSQVNPDVANGIEDKVEIAEIAAILGDRSSKTDKTLKQVDLTTSPELLFFRQGNSFNKWIRNPVLRGHIAYHKYDRRTCKSLPSDQWELHCDIHPDQRLISDKEYADIQAILDCNHRHIGTPQKTYYLTGTVTCDSCGYKMVLKSSPQYRYYGCRHGATDCSNRKCIRTEKLDEAIISAIFERACAISTADAAIYDDPEKAPEVMELRSQIADMEQMVEKYPSSLEFRQSLQSFEKQLQTVLQGFGQLNFIKVTAEAIVRHPQARQLAFWFALDQEAREVIYDKVVKQVRVRNGIVTAVQLKV